jgi:hypothetical protein
MSVIGEKNDKRSVLRQMLQGRDVIKERYVKAGVTEKENDKVIQRKKIIK